MKQDKIQIGIPCGNNSERYVKFLIKSIEKTVSGHHEIEYLIGVNHPSVDLPLLDVLLQRDPLKYKYRILSDPDAYENAVSRNFNSSAGHGECADMLMTYMESKYGMLVDADCAFLMKDWDLKLVPMVDERSIIVGSEYGSDDTKYMKNANIIVCFFDVAKLKEIEVSWVPELREITVDEENKHIYNRVVGDKIFLDTGSTLPWKLYENGYTSKYFPLVSPRIKENEGLLKFMTSELSGDEYQLDGAPIATHLGRSVSRCFKTNPQTKAWKQRVEEWLANI